MQSDTQPKKKNSTSQIILLISVGILSLVVGLWLSQQMLSNNNDSSIPPNLDATVLPNARTLVDFNLSDKNEEIFSPVQLKGQWSFLFFGFTHCPDVCPTALKVMQSVWKTLPTKMGDAGHPKLYFISVDPDRDKPEILKQYVEFFHPEFNGVTGTLDEIDKLTNQIGILYGYDEKEGSNDQEYTVNHSAQIILIDPKGRMRAVISPPHDTKMISSNFQTIRTFYGD
ncbi:MAG: SCO family protein [Gammaproteobacteria bacterium]|nr:SCO family protein [Gammaproteobacteria bacterium]MCW8988458.1 SCO family protein [Gammaproteobacteria bacterium]MCW9030674.1 SCO family protein [Gammaproteobacteria bacterium]